MITVVTGTLAGQPVTLAWEDGRLSGTQPALDMVRDAQGEFRHPGWPSVEDPDPSVQLEFIVTAMAILDDAEADGDLPTLPPLPDGARE